jgi:hypothetical protein
MAIIYRRKSILVMSYGFTVITLKPNESADAGRILLAPREHKQVHSVEKRVLLVLFNY